jgi:hypothetical protein
MFRFGRKKLGDEERVDLLEYFRDVLPLMETLKTEYEQWLNRASADGKRLTLEKDADGQHAAVYLWRVADPASDFVQREPVKAAKKYHEAYSLCLEARARAADLFKEAADLALLRDPGSLLSDANAKLLEGEKQLNKATEALHELEAILASN